MLPSAFRSKDFRLYLSGQIISLSGTWMHSVAQNWLVYSITGSSFYLGMVAGISSLPLLLFSMFGGYIADRFPKRLLLIITQCLSIIPAFITGLLVDMRLITITYIMIIAFFLGIINSFDVPTRQSFLIEMVGKESLTSAIALNSAVFNLARLIGPVMAGLIISYMSLPLCFYINAISYIPLIFVLYNIKAEGRHDRERMSILGGMKKIFLFLRDNRIILYTLILIMYFSLIGIPYIILLPIIAEEVFHRGSYGYGIFMGSIGAGSLFAAIVVAMRDFHDKKRYIKFSMVLFSISIFIFSISKSFILSIIALFIAGFGIISFLATSNSLIQHVVSDELRGRVMSLYTIVFLGMAPIGNLLIGSLASWIGALNTLRLIFILVSISILIYHIKMGNRKVGERV